MYNFITREFSLLCLFRLEQELLAKIVSQLECQTSDPTLREMADQAVLSSVEIETNSTNWIGNTFFFHNADNLFFWFLNLP